MQNLRYFLTVIAGAFSAVALAVIFPSLVPVAPVTDVLGAPETQVTFQKNLIPMTDSTYTLGTTTKAWLNLYTDEVCLAGDCKTAWPVGGSGSFASSSPWTNGYLAYVVDNNTFSSVATGTLTTTATGLQLSATRGLVGGASILSLTAGYEIPTTTRMNVWDAKGNGTVTSVAMTVPTGLAISGSPITSSGTLALTLDTGYQIPTTTRMITWDTAYGWGNHASAGYLTGNQTITLSGDVTGSGATSITTAVADDSHAHTGTTLSGIDISADTNLTADGTEIVLTGDALSLGTALTFTTATSSTSFFSALGTFTNSVINTLLTAVSGIFTTSLQIPNGTAPTVDATGEIALDTTDNQLLVGTSTTGLNVVRTKEEIYKFSIPSTSPAFAAGTTKYVPALLDGYVADTVWCGVEGGTSKIITVLGSTLTCTTGAGVSTTPSVTTVGAGSTTVGTTASTTSGVVNWLNVTITGRYTRE